MKWYVSVRNRKNTFHNHFHSVHLFRAALIIHSCQRVNKTGILEEVSISWTWLATENWTANWKFTCSFSFLAFWTNFRFFHYLTKCFKLELKPKNSSIDNLCCKIEDMESKYIYKSSKKHKYSWRLREGKIRVLKSAHHRYILFQFTEDCQQHLKKNNWSNQEKKYYYNG